MRILITGSSGFIGRQLSGRLSECGDDVVGLDRVAPQGPPRAAAFQSLRQFFDAEGLKRTIKAHQPDAVVHLAARVNLEEKHDIKGYSANIDGVRNLVEAVSQVPCVRRVIYTSSQLVCKVGYVPALWMSIAPILFMGTAKCKLNASSGRLTAAVPSGA